MKMWIISFAIASFSVLLFGVVVSRHFGGEASLSHLIRQELPLVLGLAAFVASLTTVTVTVLEKAMSHHLSFTFRTVVLVLLNVPVSYMAVYYFIFVISSV